MELANVEKINVEKNMEDLKNNKTEEDGTKNSAARNNMEEEDDYENTKDDTKGSNDNELADSLEKMLMWLAMTVKAVIHWILVLPCLPNQQLLTFLRVSIL